MCNMHMSLCIRAEAAQVQNLLKLYLLSCQENYWNQTRISFCLLLLLLSFGLSSSLFLLDPLCVTVTFSFSLREIYRLRLRALNPLFWSSLFPVKVEIPSFHSGLRRSGDSLWLRIMSFHVYLLSQKVHTILFVVERYNRSESARSINTKGAFL